MPSASKHSTVYDVASLAGVSIATVSRYFRDPEAVRPATREMVSAAVRSLGYVPSASARGLAANRTGVLGLCIPGVHGLDDPDLAPDIAGNVLVRRDDHAEIDAGRRQLYLDHVMRGVEMEAWRRGFSVMTTVIRGSHKDAAVHDIAGRVDALAVLSRTVSKDVLHHISRRVRVVVLAGPAADNSFDHVGVDNVAGMREVTAHLLRVHGYRDIAFVGGPKDSPDSSARFLGYCQALSAGGLDVPGAATWQTDFTTAGGRAAGRAMLHAGNLPRALACANDETAVGLLEVLTDAGVDVPGRVALTGFDGIEAGRLVRPRLTTVAQPMALMGRSAVDLLVGRLADRRGPRLARTLPVEVLLRESCGCSRVRTP